MNLQQFISKIIHQKGRQRSFPAASMRLLIISFFILNLVFVTSAQKQTRTEISLDENWQTTANDTNKLAHVGFEKKVFSDAGWLSVDVPHNWDSYDGYRRML